jgi:hypothetical protein
MDNARVRISLGSDAARLETQWRAGARCVNVGASVRHTCRMRMRWHAKRAGKHRGADSTGPAGIVAAAEMNSRLRAWRFLPRCYHDLLLDDID